MKTSESIAFQVFIGFISNGDSGARQGILNPPTKARLFLLCSIQSIFNRLQNGPHAWTIGFSVSID
jgi:hypothetical protein